ncbi:type II secretion system protein M [Rahnella sp. C60]|uniref:type II secretion system protein GspM n=1 Tax=Rahnella perminowiae TaxID=2816244 RepID=UPI001C27C7A8|nr:type II secretion system protein GspM [Rahnella perminowiae]UJD87571.1 type II secretion system protein M [Rahnella aquatilis]MBU9810329.1 type II secretion system protein M [Rahnella perminowiae]MBU9813853.1 type II secretion system protein M [Rahnella perminowiae]MBU9825246.1 type II secretion system protein M [Rahnella perminowiae]MCR8998983.1 type II secretion system protein M [Rahnella perminowiae]
MKQWLMLKDKRERWLILIAAFLLAVACVWYGILTPLNSRIAQSRVRINTQHHQLEWMVQQTQQLGAPSGGKVQKDKLTEAINTSATHLSLQLPQLLADERGITLSYEQISYAALLRWLEVLSQEYGIQVVAITIVTGTGQTGSVSVPQLTLR